MTREAADDLLAYLRHLKLDAELLQELERCRPGWQAWLQTAPTPAITLGAVLSGLALLCRGAAGPTPTACQVASDCELVSGAPRSAALCSLIHYLLLHGRDFDLSLLPRLQPLEEGAVPFTRAAARLASLAAAADLPARAAARGLSEAFVQDALSRLRELIFADPSGVFLADLPDLAYDLRLASLYQQGYSFSLQSFCGGMHAYRAGARSLLVVPEDGLRFDAAGYRLPPGQVDPHGWTARVTHQSGCLEVSCHVGKDGLCRQRLVTVAADTKVLSPRDEALELHIEPGADLTPEALAEALKAAHAHYHAHFPEVRPRAVFLVSWLLDPLLASLLPETSRIRRFQALFRLYPARYDEDYARQCVLPHGRPPRPTTLQRALLQHEEAGRRLREGGGFRLLT